MLREDVMPTTQRNDVAAVMALLESGALPVHLLTELRIDHAPGCPMCSPRETVCRCAPVVSVDGQQVRPRPVVEVTSA